MCIYRYKKFLYWYRDSKFHIDIVYWYTDIYHTFLEGSHDSSKELTASMKSEWLDPYEAFYSNVLYRQFRLTIYLFPVDVILCISL